MGDSLITVLSALAGGAAGEAGKQAWAALETLVTRTFGHASPASTALQETRGVSGGTGHLTGLAERLAAHARDDPGFAAALDAWLADTRVLVDAKPGPTANVISGEVHGTVIQGRDFSGPITFGDPPRTR